MVGQRSSTSTPTIGPHEVHVYDIDLSEDGHGVEALANLLDDREQAQAARFATAALRRSYVASHGNARIVLSRYLDVAPNMIQFVRNQQGKPSFDRRHGSMIRFNLSHSGDKCLVAVTSRREVGVDVERIRPLDDWREIAARFFSGRETARLSSLPSALTNPAFFATWARKEAYIKALGLGLALDLGAFEVEVDPREEARLLWTLDEREGPEQWSMRNIEVGPEYRAAVVVHGQHCDVVRCASPACSGLGRRA